MNMYLKVASLSLCATLIIFGFSGCGKIAQKASEKALEAALSDGENKVDIKLDGDKGSFQMTVKDAEGKEQALNINASEKDGGQFQMTVKGEDGKDESVNITATGGDGGQFKMTMQDEDGDQGVITGKGDDDNFSMQMNTGDGAMNITGGENATIPDSFPKDIPIYPGLILDMVQTMPAQQLFTIVAKSDDAGSKISSWYGTQLKEQGWAEQMNMTQPEMTMMSYTKEKRSLTIMTSVDGEKTAINISTSAQ